MGVWQIKNENIYEESENFQKFAQIKLKQIEELIAKTLMDILLLINDNKR